MCRIDITGSNASKESILIEMNRVQIQFLKSFVGRGAQPGDASKKKKNGSSLCIQDLSKIEGALRIFHPITRKTFKFH